MSFKRIFFFFFLFSYFSFFFLFPFFLFFFFFCFFFSFGLLGVWGGACLLKPRKLPQGILHFFFFFSKISKKKKDILPSFCLSFLSFSFFCFVLFCFVGLFCFVYFVLFVKKQSNYYLFVQINQRGGCSLHRLPRVFTLPEEEKEGEGEEGGRDDKLPICWEK